MAGIRRGIVLLLLGGVMAGLAGCAETRDRHRPFPPILPVSGQKAPGAGERVSTLTKQKEEEEGQPHDQVFRGTGRFVNPKAARQTAEVQEIDGDITLNFVNAEVRDVLKTVLGDTLAVNYVLDESITGKITFQSSRPLTREAVLPSLESALKMYGLTMVRSDNLIRVVRLADARKTAAGLRLAEGGTGFGLRIVPLRHISAEEAERVLKPFAADPGNLTVDRTRNLLMLSGTQDDLTQLEDTIALFDVDWFASMSFGLFYPRYADAAGLEAELRHIFAREDSPVSGLVDIIPIPRMNALLVVTPQPDYLKQVQTWVDRLDQRPRTPGHRLYYYRVQNAKAEDLAGALNELFTGVAQSSGRTEPIPNGEIAKNGKSARVAPVRAAARRPAEPIDPSADAPPRLVTDEKNNALIIHATPAQFELISATLDKMDVAPEQVLIEATIAEVTLRDELRFGIDWSVLSGDSEFVLSSNSGGAIASQFPGFSYTLLADTAQAAVNALATLTDVNVISSPKIMVLNNQTATLQVGDQVPVATQSAVSINDPNAPIVNSVQFRDTGVILRVTPRINNSGTVVLEVNQEVSDVVETTSSGIDSPTIQQRRIESTVAVEDGQTVALGGLIRETDSLTKNGVPFLKDIPLLGLAFSSKVKTKRRTELLIFITPRVARDAAQARAMTDYLRNRLQRLNRRLRYGETAAKTNRR